MQGPYFLISGVQVLNIVNWIRNNPSLEPTGNAMDIVSGMKQLTRVPDTLVPMLTQQGAASVQPKQPQPPQPSAGTEEPKGKPNGAEVTPTE